MIAALLFFAAFISIGLSSPPAALSYVDQQRDEGAAHGRCEYCHIPGNDEYPDDPSPDRRQWSSAPSLKKSFFAAVEISSSRLCLSCHDGSLGGDTGSHLGANRENGAGIDLTRSHPVSVEYRTDFLSGGKKLNPSAGISPLKLYNRKIECLSCHDIHGHNPAKLRMAKRELCFRCHAI